MSDEKEIAHESAYPRLSGKYEFDHNIPPQNGMTLRDYFAAKAMKITADMVMELAKSQSTFDAGNSLEFISRESYRIADAMLAERAK